MDPADRHPLTRHLRAGLAAIELHAAQLRRGAADPGYALDAIAETVALLAAVADLLDHALPPPPIDEPANAR